MRTYIVYDLEFTVLRKQQYAADIIEIGAVKLTDGDQGPIEIDRFQTYVKPERNKVITTHTTEFTGITQEQVDAAPTFPDAIDLFRQWIGDTTYYLCSWGPDDKQHFVRQCRDMKIELNWLRNMNDLQLYYTKLQGNDASKRIGLARALETAGFVFDGAQHRALDDAANTARLFVRMFDQITLEQNNAADDPLYETKLVYSSSDDGDEGHNPFGHLASLFNKPQ
ncbi:Exonuclease RNase T and DNA polymerase III [Paenibacillus curdlanolyticus YK9]|uniref:Exonuclease RNase T and DNA polymerase III n=1 Tax=Paenibacillus curdlanolyticus YK9 TaxID=717606 RepID=E0I9Y8_9BACL|nr:3'-5' exonuclease [Paenibacillus curdlanolyticus]EFM10565.1 Exonuclease RNase T and DNA polymerase III [Paenibacillus curdlanolyticus YK9]